MKQFHKSPDTVPQYTYLHTAFMKMVTGI